MEKPKITINTFLRSPDAPNGGSDLTLSGTSEKHHHHHDDKLPTAGTVDVEDVDNHDPDSSEPPPETLLDRLLVHVNFYRIHLTAFTFIPLITSGVFYASNGRFRISYLDSLFLCYSAMTVTGLSTVNLSTLTPWQQVILYLLMIIGDITMVSWVMVLIRKRFFRTHCEWTVTMKKKKEKKKEEEKAKAKTQRLLQKSRSMFKMAISSPRDRRPQDPFVRSDPGPTPEEDVDPDLHPKNFGGSRASRSGHATSTTNGSSSRPSSRNVRDLSIVVSPATPKHTMQMALPTTIPEAEEPETGILVGSALSSSPEMQFQGLPPITHSPVQEEIDLSDNGSTRRSVKTVESDRGSGESESPVLDVTALSASPKSEAGSLPKDQQEPSPIEGLNLGPHTFGPDDVEYYGLSPATGAHSAGLGLHSQGHGHGVDSAGVDSSGGFSSGSGTDYGEVKSMVSGRTVRWEENTAQGNARYRRPAPKRSRTVIVPPRSRSNTLHSPLSVKDEGFGGFPGPVDLLTRFAQRAAPRKVTNALTRSATILSEREIRTEKTPWILMEVPAFIIGRNSDFRTETLTDEQVEAVGGAEYRALRLLSYLIPAYFVCCQLFSYILFTPWLSTTTDYDEVFEAQPRFVPKPWFALFQVMGAYTGGGLSLVDVGMVPFQRAYLMIVGMMFSILAGNHALPIFLRFIIWIGSRRSTPNSGLHVAFTFLLDHPRRCFLYLFPSHQTWFLLLCLAVFSVIEWVSFLVLNIGIPVYEELPTGTKVIAGLFQGLAARASGFSIVPIASLAPALQFLYVVMMYIAIYPVAMSIRSTNVYEERSLGVFEAPPDDEDEEPDDLHKLGRKERVGKYIGWHLRRQMSIDIWWLVWGLALILVIERENIMDEDKKWFDVFRVIFELVSAFGGIGLTLGIPTDNYGFVGAMKPLSKLVVIVIMVRGRHRGLPVAVDRAIKLPREMVTGPHRKPSMNPQQMEEVKKEFNPV
ncbi:potassium transporter [Coprinopsis cinerea AmutBmut pab1-1]|nr:potassium transporter [Coprinopsis cinerea AmutBmut pab1-1]